MIDTQSKLTAGTYPNGIDQEGHNLEVEQIGCALKLGILSSWPKTNANIISSLR